MLSTASHNTKKTEQANPARSDRPKGRSGWALQDSSWLAELRFTRPLGLLGLALPARPGFVVLASLILATMGLHFHVRWHPTIPARFVLRSDTAYSTFRYTSAALNPLENTDSSAEANVVAEGPVITPTAGALFPGSDPAWKPANPQPAARIPVLPVYSGGGQTNTDALVQASAFQPVRENCYDAHLKQRADLLGDTPMMRNWQMFGVQAMMLAMFTAGPALADTSGPPDDSEKLTEIQKQLKEMDKAIGDLKKTLQGLDLIGREVVALRNEMGTVRTEMGSVRTALGAIDDLKVEIARMKADMEKLRTSRPAETRTALSPPSDLGIPPPAMGRVEIVNTYPTMQTVLVNNRSYRVQPGETLRTDLLPAGAFSYWVLGVTEPRTRVLEANKVYTIHVYPLQ